MCFFGSLSHYHEKSSLTMVSQQFRDGRGDRAPVLHVLRAVPRRPVVPFLSQLSAFWSLSSRRARRDIFIENENSLEALMKSCSCPLQLPHYPIVFGGKALSSMHTTFGSFNSPMLWSVFDAYLKEFPKANLRDRRTAR